MGEIENILVEEDATNIYELVALCEQFSQNSCRDYFDRVCPFWKEHIGCLFRQGKTPKEW